MPTSHFLEVLLPLFSSRCYWSGTHTARRSHTTLVLIARTGSRQKREKNEFTHTHTHTHTRNI